jgi:hypothetical protein
MSNTPKKSKEPEKIDGITPEVIAIMALPLGEVGPTPQVISYGQDVYLLIYANSNGTAMMLAWLRELRGYDKLSVTMLPDGLLVVGEK